LAAAARVGLEGINKYILTNFFLRFFDWTGIKTTENFTPHNQMPSGYLNFSCQQRSRRGRIFFSQFFSSLPDKGLSDADAGAAAGG
jgi:hypothetical protein